MARIPAVSDGARLTQDITFSDNSGVAFGKADDITVRWDGTDLDVLPAADDSVVKWGNGTLSLDQWWYGGSSASYLRWDASTNKLRAVGPVQVEGFNTIPDRYELKWVAGTRGKPGINADMVATAESTRNVTDRDFELLGDNVASSVATFYAEGGIKLLTAATNNDEIILLPHEDANQSAWKQVTWGTDKKTIWECMITSGSAITNSAIWAGLKMTNTDVVADDPNQIFFRYQSGVGAGKWQVISSRADTDVTVTTDVTVAVSTSYHLKIVIGSDRSALCYINGALVDTAAALVAVDLIPYIGLGVRGAAEAKFLIVQGQAISRTAG